MKLVHVKGNKYIDFNNEFHQKDPEFKVGDHLRKSIIKLFLLKDVLQIGLKKFLWLKIVKNTIPWTYVINDLNGEKSCGTYYEKQL